MSLLSPRNSLRRLGESFGADESKKAEQEHRADTAEETEFCPKPQKRWFERIPEALASILEENTNGKVAADEHPGDSTVEATAQKGKAKCRLGRGMRALLQD